MKGVNMRLAKLIMLLTASLLCCACALAEASRKEGIYHYQMGVSYFNEGNMTSALTELTKAEEYDSSNPELYNYLGMAYYSKKKLEMAEKKYLAALSINPNHCDARNNLGVVYMDMQRWDDAIAQFRQVSEDIFYQNQVAAHINLGLAYMGKGDYPKALSTLRGVVADYPRDPRGRMNLGRVYSSLEKYDLAINEYKRAVEQDINYAVAYYYLGLAYIKTKNNIGAQAAFKEVIRIAPDSEIGQLSREYMDTMK
jgi:Tfp pilus assembly protein PilF